MSTQTIGRAVGRQAGWIVLGLSVAAWLAVITITHQPFHVGPRALRYFDLRIYAGGGHRLLDGRSLYATPILGVLGFTYPPFSAMLFAPLGDLPFRWIAGIVTAVNLILLLVTMRLALRLHDGRDGSARSAPAALAHMTPWSWAALAAGVAIWCEPVSVTLGYGQIDLLVTILVVADLTLPDGARAKGAATGLAAAIKLTPLVFLLFLAVSGRRRAAALGGAVFAATIALAFVVVPADASRFWGHPFRDASGVGGPVDPSDQSLRGLIARLGLGGHHLQIVWLIAAVVAVVVTLALARELTRRGDEVGSYALIGVGTLLASPISWTHHWTLVIPALALLARRAWTRRSGWLALAAGLLGVISLAWLPDLSFNSRPVIGPVTLVSDDQYVVAGVLVIVVCGWAMLRARRRAGVAVPRALHHPAALDAE